MPICCSTASPNATPSLIRCARYARPEKGLRADRKSGVEGVTGVQTCALPIYLLTVINGYADLLLDGVAERDPFADSLREIRKAGERAASRSEERRGGSDWSSDVCSSDLFADRDQRLCRFAARRRRRTRPLR